MKPPKANLPIWLVAVPFGILEFFGKLLKKDTGFNLDRLRKFSSSTHYTSEKLWSKTGNQKYTSESELRDMVKWFKERKMILLALNELNLDYIKGYVSQGKLASFGKLLEHGVVNTTSENKYELLEPWIQWATVQTADCDEHQVFRLGDIVETRPPDLRRFRKVRSFSWNN